MDIEFFKLHLMLCNILLQASREGQGVWVKDVTYNRNGTEVTVGKDKYGYNVPAKNATGGSSEPSKEDKSNAEWSQEDFEKGFEEGVKGRKIKRIPFLDGIEAIHSLREKASNLFASLPEEAQVGTDTIAKIGELAGTIAVTVAITLGTKAVIKKDAKEAIDSGDKLYGYERRVAINLATPLLMGSAFIQGIAMAGSILMNQCHQLTAIHKGIQDSLPLAAKEAHKELDKSARLLYGNNAENDPNLQPKIESLSLLGHPKEMRQALQRDAKRTKRRSNEAGITDKSPEFKQRVLETIDLIDRSQKGGLTKEEKISLEWHKGLIDAELNFGERVDLISKEDKGYNNTLYNSIAKDLKQIHKSKPANNLVELESVEGESEDSPKQQKLKQKVYDNVVKQEDRLSEISGLSLKHSLKVADNVRPHINLDGTSMTLNPSSLVLNSEVWHEAGHILEKNSGFLEKDKNYINSRLTKDREGSPMPLRPSLWMKTVYTPEELKEFRASNFDDPYITKEYPPEVKATELLSMGIQSFNNGPDLAKLAKSDREHLMYTLYFLSEPK